MDQDGHGTRQHAQADRLYLLEASTKSPVHFVSSTRLLSDTTSAFLFVMCLMAAFCKFLKLIVLVFINYAFDCV